MVDCYSLLSLTITHLITKHDNLKEISEYIISSNIDRECINRRHMVRTFGDQTPKCLPVDLFKMILEVPL